VAGDETDILLAARHIAEDLCREAVWAGGSCAWVGLEHAFPSRELQAQVIGGDLYGGTAGVAYFLADAYLATGEPIFRRTAMAALRHARFRAADMAGNGMYGLYNGVMGVAFAAAVLGESLLDDEALDWSSSTLRRPVLARWKVTQNDVVSGLAGVLIALLALAKPAKTDLLEPAREMGEELLSRAIAEPVGFSWPMAGGASPRLNGYSHGASGVGLALLELHSSTGDERFARAAKASFAFERTTMSDGSGDWPDLRGLPTRLSFPNAWCHGSAGILMARTRASKLLRDPEIEADRTAADIATQSKIRGGKMPGTDCCLCHGTLGLASILSYRRAPPASGPDLAAQLVDRSIRSRSPAGVWPTRFGAEENTPQLMIGAAGIGEALLRMAGRSSLPWVLHVTEGPSFGDVTSRKSGGVGTAGMETR
jgi:lantibiotic modifying enzyme